MLNIELSNGSIQYLGQKNNSIILVLNDKPTSWLTNPDLIFGPLWIINVMVKQVSKMSLFTKMALFLNFASFGFEISLIIIVVEKTNRWLNMITIYPWQTFTLRCAFCVKLWLKLANWTRLSRSPNYPEATCKRRRN